MSSIPNCQPGSSPTPPERKVWEVIRHYLAHLQWRVQRSTFKNRHYQNVERTLTNFGSIFGEQVISQCSRRDLTRWLESNPSWRAYWTVRANLSAVSNCFGWAEDEDLIFKNPYPSRQARKLLRELPPKTRRPAATDFQYAAIMRCASRAVKRISYFLFHAGPRPCEPRELTWSQVNLELGIITIDNHKTVRQQSEPRPREFAVTPGVLRLLRNLHKRQPDGIEHVFLTSRRRPWTRTELCHQFKIAVRRALRKKAIGLNRFQRIGSDLEKITPYSLRHTRATKAFVNGTPDQWACDHFGWTSSAMCQIYKHTAGNWAYLQKIAEHIAKRDRRDEKRTT